MTLDRFVTEHALHTPQALAVTGPDDTLTYGELDQMARCAAHILTEYGISKGDRVGIWLEKSAQSVAWMQGALRIGAIYIPLDPFSPPARIQQILRDCKVGLLVSTRKRAERVLTGDLLALPACRIEDIDLRQSMKDLPARWNPPEATDLAYILYTSGSTGTPKGICISHQNALAFIQWAVEYLQITPHDRLANHAPFHFDLSVLDLYGAFAAGASVFLIPDGMSYLPQQLLTFILQEHLTIWYSVPSVLIMLMESAGFCDQQSLPLRAILFAGEPFPGEQLRKLYKRWSSTVRLLNLYGPTETNVCTFFEIEGLDDFATHPLPIGRACSGDEVWAVKEDGSRAGPGKQGELVVSGPTVMHGYWGQPPQNQQVYHTGDIVRLEEDGNYTYLGRRDQMVKVRGHRVELAEIEAVLGRHPAIQEVAALVAGNSREARLIACAVSKADPLPSLLQLKKYCAEQLPRYMIIDAVHFLPYLPRTHNGKIDRLQLAQQFGEERI